MLSSLRHIQIEAASQKKLLYVATFRFMLHSLKFKIPRAVCSRDFLSECIVFQMIQRIPQVISKFINDNIDQNFLNFSYGNL